MTRDRPPDDSQKNTDDSSTTEHQAEPLDFYEEAGRIVFTSHYLLKRGHCCRSGCRHCPYGYNAAKTSYSND